MTIYSFTEARERLGALLERALREGQVRFANSEGKVFVIRPERQPKTSPFNVRSLNLGITKMEILDAIRESRARY